MIVLIYGQRNSLSSQLTMAKLGCDLQAQYKYVVLYEHLCKVACSS